MPPGTYAEPAEQRSLGHDHAHEGAGGLGHEQRGPSGRSRRIPRHDVIGVPRIHHHDQGMTRIHDPTQDMARIHDLDPGYGEDPPHNLGDPRVATSHLRPIPVPALIAPLEHESVRIQSKTI